MIVSSMPGDEEHTPLCAMGDSIELADGMYAAEERVPGIGETVIARINSGEFSGLVGRVAWFVALQ